MTGRDDQAVPAAGDGSLSSRLRSLLASLDAAAAAAGNGAGPGSDEAGAVAPAAPRGSAGDGAGPGGVPAGTAAGDGDPAPAPDAADGAAREVAGPGDGERPAATAPVGVGEPGPAPAGARDGADGVADPVADAPGDGEEVAPVATAPGDGEAPVRVATAQGDGEEAVPVPVPDARGDGTADGVTPEPDDGPAGPVIAATAARDPDGDSAGAAAGTGPVIAATAAGDPDRASAGAAARAGPGTAPAPPGAPAPARRRTTRVRRRYGRVRAAAFGTTLALLVGAIPVLTWLGVETISDSSQGQVIEPETDASAPGFEALVEPTPTLLLAHEDDDGGLAGLTVLGLGFGDEGGDVLFVPVGTMADIPSVGVDRLAVAFDRGGIDLVRESTESLLDVRFTEVLAIDAARWAALVAPVAPLSVTNPDPVVVVADDGSATVAFPAGNIDVAAEDVSALLATRSTDETQLARLVRHQAFWEAWLGAVRAAPPGSAVPGEVTTGIGRFVRGLAAGDVVYETLRVASAPATPEGDEAYEADPDAVAAQISELLPFAAAPEGGDRARVRVLNGTGDPALTPVVTRVLVPAGAEIAVIGNADRFDYDRTQVVYYDQAQAEVAERLRDAMGVGEVVLSTVPNDAVDVTVVVGSDFALPAAAEGGQDGGSDGTG